MLYNNCVFILNLLSNTAEESSSSSFLIGWIGTPSSLNLSMKQTINLLRLR